MKHHHSFDNFRAISIIFIVFSHCTFLLDTNSENNFTDLLIINFLGGATFFFVFITGYLTPKIFYKKYSYKKFISQKIKKLIPPYLILSIPMILIFIGLNKGIFFEKSNTEQFLLYIFTGNTFAAYWYIPFILLIFLLYPIFRKIDTLPKTLISITFTFSILSLIIQRPIDNINVIQSVIYYTPVYLIGSIVSKYYSLFSNKKLIPLYFVLFAFFLILECYTGHEGNYHSNPFIYNGIDLMFIQKTFLTLLLFSLLENHLNQEVTILNNIAKNSFGIFFIHMPIIMFFSILNKSLILNHGFFSFIFISSIIFLISILAIKLIKTLIKDKSKFIIGV